MIWRVEVATKPHIEDKLSDSVLKQLKEFCADKITHLKAFRIFLIEGDFDQETLESFAANVLADPVIEDARIMDAQRPPDTPKDLSSVLIFKKPGVMDPVEGSAKKSLLDHGIKAKAVKTGLKFLLKTTLTDDFLRRIIYKALANEVVDEVTIGDRTFKSLLVGQEYKFELKIIPARSMDDRQLLNLNKQSQLSLSLDELKEINRYFESISRDPTDCELETIAQTWSEHCKHKTFTSDIEFNGELVKNLLKSTIMRATQEINHPSCVSVFVDNAGIVRFNDRFNICVKVETHNHPSAIEPYGGSNTGLGGVIRDILGCGLGAKPVANIDVFAVGDLDTKDDELAKGIMHPRRLLRGLVSGVRDYGNRMGIPTVAGAVIFDQRFLANPLVYCGTVGIIPADKSTKKPEIGDLIVVVGGRTGRDGIHGATFSSIGLDEKSETASIGAVQIGNAIEEKKLLDALIEARDKNVYDCITDCGAGGISCAVGEMGQYIGAEVDLEKVPLKYEGLSYSEIWISEAQERMVLSCNPAKLNELLSICNSHAVEATVIGRFTGDRRLRVRYKSTVVCDMPMDFVHHGLPRTPRKAIWKKRLLKEPVIKPEPDYNQELLRILADPNVASKEKIIRQYDHEVQGRSVVKPICGIANDGPSDGVVLRPILDSKTGLAIGLGINPRYSDIDPYQMALNAIDEAIRNVVAVGADPSEVFLLDNFCWASPDDHEALGALVLAAKACYEGAKAFGTPFISGKDSLNNEFRHGSQTIKIPHTLLITAVGIVSDITRCITPDFKSPHNLLYLIGLTKDELGGSLFYSYYNETGANVPEVDLNLAPKVFKVIHTLITEGLIESCHDISEGGLAIALSEMAIGGRAGADVNLAGVSSSIDSDYKLLFSESPTRFIIEVKPENRNAVEQTLAVIPHGMIGQVTKDGLLKINGVDRKEVISLDVEALKDSWLGGLKI